jgi:hypothetical protein
MATAQGAPLSAARVSSPSITRPTAVAAGADDEKVCALVLGLPVQALAGTHRFEGDDPCTHVGRETFLLEHYDRCLTLRPDKRRADGVRGTQRPAVNVHECELAGGVDETRGKRDCIVAAWLAVDSYEHA